MEIKYAVALINGDDEEILGIFDTIEEADEFGTNNRIPRECGLQYCFSSAFKGGVPQGNSIGIYTYYNSYLSA